MLRGRPLKTSTLRIAVGGIIQCGHFADKEGKGVFRCGCPHVLAQKIRIFRIYGVSAWTRGRG